MESRDFLEWLLHSGIQITILVLLPPFFVGLIVKLKAVAAGRQGPPILQSYYDLARLCRKGTVYSQTTGPVFRLGPIFVVASAMLAGLMLPIAGMPAVLHFSGDLIVFAYVLALGRLAIVLAALDTGSSFEGMGASREVSFAATAEPTFFLILISIGLLGHADPHNFGVEWSLTGTLAQMEMITWVHYGPALLPLSFALFVLLLLETSRVPFDDPTTHLELTMIHEVMILDHSGPDLALMEYGAALKLMILNCLLGRIIFPHHFDNVLADVLVFFIKVSALSVMIVMVEVFMARLRMKQIQGVLLGALILAALSVVVMLVELGEFRGLPT
ncbi:MAG: NADH-quinone oxidoreductase subunit H [Planctomycetota bacterium]